MKQEYWKKLEHDLILQGYQPLDAMEIVMYQMAEAEQAEAEQAEEKEEEEE